MDIKEIQKMIKLCINLWGAAVVLKTVVTWGVKIGLAILAGYCVDQGMYGPATTSTLLFLWMTLKRP